jgi:hypothetical protein
MMQVSNRTVTSIPQVWEMDGYQFTMICSILIEDLSQESPLSGTKGPLMSAESIQAFGRWMESING